MNRDITRDDLNKIANQKFSISTLSIKINDFLKITPLKNQQKDIRKIVDYYTNYKKIKAEKLKHIRDNFIKLSGDNKRLQIRTHVLDCAIQEACKKYKSCISNLLEGNIKKFRIRYWKVNKENRVMHIGSEYLKGGNIFSDVLKLINVDPKKIFSKSNKYYCKQDIEKRNFVLYNLKNITFRKNEGT